jgi:hypothetical protein
VSELLTFVGTSDVGITPGTRAGFFRLPRSSDIRLSELPTWVKTFGNGTSSRGHYSFIWTPNWTFHKCFFEHLDERNAMVKSILYFDNFIKWKILVVNRSI